MFKDREQAGEKLALKLKKTIKGEGFLVVALLRGGIVLGKKISDYFKIPLSPLAVKKIGAPSNPELAIGAITFDGTSYFDHDLIESLSIDERYIKSASEIKRKEAKNLQKKFPTSSRKAGFRGARVVIVDDGVATGTTAICAAIYARKEKAKEIILGTPMIGKESLNNIKTYFDRIVSLKNADNLVSVSQFYEHFPQVSDEEVLNYLVQL